MSRRPVVVIAGGCGNAGDPSEQKALELLSSGLVTRQRRIYLSGGTRSGVCEAAGNARARSPHVKLVGFTPARNPDGTVSEHNVPLDCRYDEHRHTRGTDFSAAEVAQYWRYISRALRVEPSSVLLVGAGGGGISRHEYDTALRRGATLLLIGGSGRAADAFLEQHLRRTPKVYATSVDASVRSFQSRVGRLVRRINA